MPDLSHNFGNDLSLSPTGDLATVTGTILGQQRVLRRLLTNAGAYIWQIAYGAGLPSFVGQPARADAIAAVIRAQMLREAAVSRTPEPAITVVDNGDTSVFVDIQYVDAASGQSVILSFPV